MTHSNLLSTGPRRHSDTTAICGRTSNVAYLWSKGETEHGNLSDRHIEENGFDEGISTDFRKRKKWCKKNDPNTMQTRKIFRYREQQGRNLVLHQRWLYHLYRTWTIQRAVALENSSRDSVRVSAVLQPCFFLGGLSRQTAWEKRPPPKIVPLQKRISSPEEWGRFDFQAKDCSLWGFPKDLFSTKAFARGTGNMLSARTHVFGY